MTEPDRPVFSIPPPQVTVPSQGEDYIFITRRDWDNLRRRLEALKERRQDFRGLAWAALGLLGGDLVAGATWVPVWSDFADDQRLKFMWVWGVIAVIGAGSLVATILAFRIAGWADDTFVDSVAQILEDTEDMPRI